MKFSKFRRSSFLTEHLRWLLLIIWNSNFEHWKWRHKNGMLDETRSKPIQPENCVGWAWKCCMKCETTTQCCCIGTYISLRHHTFTYVYWISVLPLPKMNGDFAAKFIWTCAFLFIYSLAGEIFLFKIVKMNLINSRREKSPELSNQSKHKFSTLPSNKFPSDQIEDGC